MKNLDWYGIKCIQTYYSILDGSFGELVAGYFKNSNYSYQQERILYHIISRERTGMRSDEFRSILVELFPDGVTFYYNKFENTIYVSFVAVGNDEQRETYEVCKFLFADLLMDIQVRWNLYPHIIGNKNSVIAKEDEQRCGTIV